MFSKVFEKLAYNRVVDHVEKCSLFSDFQYDFKSSPSTADLRVFNRSRATRTVTLDMSKAFGRVWYSGHLHKLMPNFRLDICPYFLFSQ